MQDTRFYVNGMRVILAGLVGLFLVTGYVGAERQRAEPQVIKADHVAQGNNAFALDLYGQLKDKPGNLFFSPYSISTALNMTYVGARGPTQRQMAEVLKVPVRKEVIADQRGEIERISLIPPEQLNLAYGAFIRQLNEQGKKGDYQLQVANALWGQQGYGFLEEFLQQVREYYGAGLHEVDFQDAAAREKARETINKWVEMQTNDKIRDLIKPGMLDDMTRLVLTNAIYFKGDWALQFDKKNTKDLPFYISPEDKIDVPTMSHKDRFMFGEVDDLQVLELPYKGNDLSMVVLLPKKKEGLAAMEKNLNTKNLEGWLAKMNRREVQVFLPKFRQTCEFGLGEVLSRMGMKDAFSPGQADFSGMNGRQDLFISAVLHKAFVEVNEEGTEAAAATGIIVGVTSIPLPPPEFRADHPFVFMIRDAKTGAILFMGRIVKPE